MQPSKRLHWSAMSAADTAVDTTAAMQRVVAFVNTRDLDNDVDEWDSPAALGEWLRANDLATGLLTVREADLETARALREGLRQALLAHDLHAEAEPPEVGRVAAVPLELQIDTRGEV